MDVMWGRLKISWNQDAGSFAQLAMASSSLPSQPSSLPSQHWLYHENSQRECTTKCAQDPWKSQKISSYTIKLQWIVTVRFGAATWQVISGYGRALLGRFVCDYKWLLVPYRVMIKYYWADRQSPATSRLTRSMLKMGHMMRNTTFDACVVMSDMLSCPKDCQ